ncbi:MAG TPA: hypothetical protein VKZ59_08230 [Acidobacteriota bacterium]|nr:hypothetical protein [Acidobacteriota bacterium]
MKFNLIVRRTHLYLGIFLLPWFLMYSISSLPFSHRSYLDAYYDDGTPLWVSRWEGNYYIPLDTETDHRKIGAQVMQEFDLEGSFGTYQPAPDQLAIYIYDFWNATQVRYFHDEKRLVIQDRRFRWDHFLTGMHARGGFQQASFLADLWAVIVDIVCVAMMTWVASGLYMWWQLKSVRRSGALVILSGTLSFVLFLFLL